MTKYYWSHYSPNNVYEIISALKSEKKYKTTWGITFNGNYKSVTVFKDYSALEYSNTEFNDLYSKMDSFPYLMDKAIFKAIFNNLKVSN